MRKKKGKRIQRKWEKERGEYDVNDNAREKKYGRFVKTCPYKRRVT